MNILLLCTMVNEFDRAGFYNSQEVGFARGLTALGNQVTILRGIDQNEEEEKRIVDGTIPFLRIHMRHLGAHGYLDTRMIPENTEAVIAFSDQQLFLHHVLSWCRKRGIPFVMYAGTTLSVRKGMHAKISNALFHLVGAPVYRRAGVLAKTPEARKQLEALGIRGIVLAPVGLDEKELHAPVTPNEREKIREKFGFAKDEIVLLSVLRLVPEKRPLELLELVSRIQGKKHFRLVMIGEGELKKEVTEHAEALDLSSSLILLDRVPYEHMWEYYTASDYYISMNLGEIFGMSIMEAVYYRTSVAARIAPGPSVTLKGLKGHQLCASDEEIEAWLCSTKPDDAALMESSRQILERFSWKSTAKKAQEKILEMQAAGFDKRG